MMRVAVVDDSPVMRRCVADMLATVRGACVVGFAATRASAVALIDAEQPDLVVLDIELQDGDRGMDVLRHVAHAHPNVRVMVLSNYGWGAMRGAFLAAGAHAYFDKAFEFGEAHQWVTRLAAAAGREPVRRPPSHPTPHRGATVR